MLTKNENYFDEHVKLSMLMSMLNSKNLMCSSEFIPEHALEHILSTTKNVTNKIRTCSAEHILEKLINELSVVP